MPQRQLRRPAESSLGAPMAHLALGRRAALNSEIHETMIRDVLLKGLPVRQEGS